MKKTSVFATKEEIESLKAMINAPVLMFGETGPSSPQEECHRLALKHGLPEITGRYGIVAGEFVS